MFPESHYLPAFSAQDLIDGLVSLSIRVEFAIPEISVSFGAHPMPWAAMPLTTVDENCNPTTGENDIGLTSQFRSNPVAGA